jgi:hypothetical protein
VDTCITPKAKSSVTNGHSEWAQRVKPTDSLIRKVE